MEIQTSWLLQKPTDLDLHCMQKQGLSGFSRTRVNGRMLVFDCLINSTLFNAYNVGHWVKFSADDILKYFFVFSPEHRFWLFYGNCLHERQFAWNVKSCLLGKNKKKISVCVICWIRIEQRVVKVKSGNLECWGACVDEFSCKTDNSHEMSSFISSEK